MSLAKPRREPLTLDQLTESDLFRIEQPRIALFGEFSAGKSSLANLLAGTDILPTSILSSTRRLTRLCYADRHKITAINDREQRSTVELSEITSPTGEDFIEVEIRGPFERLRHLEILDTPGFADPYQDSGRTLDVAEQADLGIWCTRANQAWRHSEWAVWAGMTKRLHRSGLLVVTRCDSLRAADRRALLNRLRHETEGLFAGIVMLSIPDARDAQDPVSGALDGERWQQSGGETLAAELQNAVEVVAAEDDLPDTPEPAPPRTKIKTPTASVSGAADALEVPLSVDPEPARLSDQSMEPATMGSLSPIDVAGLLDNMLDAMPACRFMAYVDLDSARPLAVSVRGQMGTPPRMDDSLAVLAVDLFIGPASTSMRRLALKGATVERDSADMIREVTIEGGRVHYVLLRRQDQPNHALIAIIDKDQPISLALAASRMTLTKFVEQQQRERSDETAASAEEAS